MSSGPSLGVAYLTIMPSMKGSAAIIEKELGGVSTTAIGGKLGRQLTGGMKTVATAAMAGVGVAAGAAFVKGFGRLRAIDDAKAKLRGLGNDAKTIELVMKNAGASVKGTAYGLDAAATAAAGAMAAGIKPGRELERNLKLVADAATIAGTDMGSMGAIFNKVAASNKVQMDVINQLHDAGVPALSFLAKTMGVTAEEASKLASKGQIDFATFQRAMEEGLGGAALSSGETFTGALANVFAALGRIGAGIMGGVFPQIAPLFQRIQEALAPLEERAAALGTVIGERVTPVLEQAMGLLEGGTGQLSSMTNVLGPVTGAFVALGASGLAPLLRVIPGLGGLAGMLTTLGGPLGLVAGAFLGMVATSPELQAALGGLLGAVGGLAQSLAPALSQIATILTGALTVGLGWLADGLTVAVGWLSSFLTAIAPYSDLLISVGIGVGAVVLAFKAWTFAGNTLKAAMAIWKAVQLGWTAASYGAAGASYAATAATKGQAIATNVAAGAQKALNLVMRANPLGLILTAITAVVGALTWFFTQTDTGKAIWAEFTRFLREAWANISSFFQAVWENVLKPVFEGIGQVLGFVWNSILKPVFDGIAATATWVFQNILVPAFEVAQFGFAVLGGIFQGIWEAILKPVFDAIGAVFQWLYNHIVVPVIAGIQAYVRLWGAIFSWLWTTILKPVFDAIARIFNWIWTNVISPVITWIQDKLRLLGLGFQLMWTNYVKPALDAIAQIFNWIWTNVISPVITWIQDKLRLLGLGFEIMWGVVRQVWDNVTGKIQAGWNVIKGVIDTMSRIVRTDPKKAFEAARDAVGTAWAGIQDLAKKPVRFVIETVINGLIGTINKIPGVNIPKVPLPPGFARGGILPGMSRMSDGDDQLIMARRGEGMMVSEALRTSADRAAFLAANDAGRRGVGFASMLQGLARGGLVNPLPKGSYSVSQPYHGGHNGIDLAAPSGTKIMAAATGTVGLASSVPMGGNEVYVQHGSGLGTRYSHLSRFATTAGQTVRQGQTIGYVGSTGMSTGPHLHYMVHNPGGGGGNYGNHVNPAPYMGVFSNGFNPLVDIIDGIAKWATEKFTSAFPGTDMWVQAAGGMMRQGVEQAVAWAKSKIGLDDIGTTLYDTGGLLPPGISLVENRTGRPEPILTGAQWDVMRRAAEPHERFPREVVLKVRDREFEAYIEDLADERIQGAASAASPRSLNDRLGVGG